MAKKKRRYNPNGRYSVKFTRVAKWKDQTCSKCGKVFQVKSRKRKRCYDCRFLCACGCGEYKKTTQGKYKNGHYVSMRPCVSCGVSFLGKAQRSLCESCRVQKPCGCGCGKYPLKETSLYLQGHFLKGKKHRQDWCDNIRKGLSKKSVRERMSQNIGAAKRTPEARARASIARIQNLQKKSMKDQLRKSHAAQGSNKKQTTPEHLIHQIVDKQWSFVGARLLFDGTINPDIDKVKDLPVGADFVNLTTRTLLFVDGCYWHECPLHGRGRFPGKPERDQILTSVAESKGWNVLRFWEHEIKEDQGRVAGLIQAA